jgi:hypothetical protein
VASLREFRNVSVNNYALGMELRFKDGEDLVLFWVFL